MTPQARLLVPALIAAAALAGAGEGEGRGWVTFKPGGERDPHATFEVSGRGVDPALIEALARDPGRLGKAVRVVTAGRGEGDDDRPALLGTYEVDVKAGVLRFRTRFPTEPGVSYRVVFRPTPADPPRRATFTVPDTPPRGATTEVVRVSPAGDVLPENLLKFYVEFSAPMGRGHAYEHVRLLDATGETLDLPFLELGEELWDPRGVRFTLLFDPGRLKKGLKPREELGPVLEAGKRYTLVVDRGWRDAAGDTLKGEFRKSFRAGPPDLTPPDPNGWTLERPAAGTRRPLVAFFPEPLDRALLGRVLGVTNAAGTPVVGAVRVGDDETSWAFTPDEPWAPGGYDLRIDRTLEDRAGNSVGRPFEVDVFEKIERHGTAGAVTLPFRVSGGE